MKRRPIQFKLHEERNVSLLDLLEAAEGFTGKPKPICFAKSTSTRDIDFVRNPCTLVLDSIVPVPKLLAKLEEVIRPQLSAIFVPASSQFTAIVHPASTTLPFKRLHRLEKDNESQFEQGNLAPVLKIMAFHMAYNQILQETRRKPEYAAVFKRWVSPNFQRSSFQFFASSTLATKNITDFGIHSCLLPDNGSRLISEPKLTRSFTVEAVVEVKTTHVLTEKTFADVTGWFEVDKEHYVPGMAIQYVWPDEAPSKTNNKTGGAGSTKDQSQDKILRQVWGQMVQENTKFAILTNATLSFYLFRRDDNSGNLYISPPYPTGNNVALYLWLSAALRVNGVNADTIETPTVNKAWWDELPTFEATGIRPATLPKNQVAFMKGLPTVRNVRNLKRRRAS